PSVAVIGGGGIRPAIISRKNESPSSSRAAAADAVGSAHSYVRCLPLGSVTVPPPPRSRQPRFPFRVPAATTRVLATGRRPVAARAQATGQREVAARGLAAAQRPARGAATTAPRVAAGH